MVDTLTGNRPAREKRSVGAIDRPVSRSESQAHDDILKAAESCFEYFGFRKTTVDDIAKSAGISRTTVYRFFKDRDALLSALVLKPARTSCPPPVRTSNSSRPLRTSWSRGCSSRSSTATRTCSGNFWSARTHGHHQPAHPLLLRGLALTTPLWEPLIAAGQQRREVKADLDVHDGCRWIVLVNVIAFSRNDLVPEDTDGLRAWIRQFVLPPFTIGVSARSQHGRTLGLAESDRAQDR